MAGLHPFLHIADGGIFLLGGWRGRGSVTFVLSKVVSEVGQEGGLLVELPFFGAVVDREGGDGVVLLS